MQSVGTTHREGREPCGDRLPFVRTLECGRDLGED